MGPVPAGLPLMALSQRLEFRQSQALVMTPQLMQAIKLLQLSSLDLAAYVDAELERNPLLERVNDGEAGTEGSSNSGADPAVDGERPDNWQAESSERDAAGAENGFSEALDRDTGADNVFPDD